MDAEIGARVKSRMKDARPGMTQAELAALIGVAPDALSRSLNGKRAFSAVELVDLARELTTSVHWFVTGEPDPFALKVAGRQIYDHQNGVHEGMDWDTLHDFTALLRRAYIQAYAEQGGVPRLNQGPLKAQDARRRLHEAGGEHWVRSLADGIEREFGIDVVRVAEAPRDFSAEVLGHSIIVLKESQNWFYENWSLAHELGHIVAGDLSHIRSSGCDDPGAERRANAFASELLLPESSMREVDWSSIDLASAAGWLWKWGISTRVLTIRLGALRLSAPPALIAALSQPTQRFLRGALPSEISSEMDLRAQQAASRRFPESLIAAHRHQVMDGRIDGSILAWMLGVDEGSVESELAPPAVVPDLDWLARELGLEG